MNYQQIRQIGKAMATAEEAAAELSMVNDRLMLLEQRQQVLCEVVNTLLTRGKGRPSREEMERLEQLRGQMNGSTH